MEDVTLPACPLPRPFETSGDGADTLLLFADISGYTRFVWENRYTQAHAADVVRRLLDAVVDALEPDLTLAKLEGDAAFCAAPPGRDGLLGQRLLAAFDAFVQRRAHVMATNACPCEACRTVDALDLKMIVHRGPVVRHAARMGEELAGLPVILLHRLSKNGVKRGRYILWTEDAAAALADLPADTVVRRTERYPDLGPDLGVVAVRVFTAFPGAPPYHRASWLRRAWDHLQKMRSWLPLILRRVPGKAEALAGEHHHEPGHGSGHRHRHGGK